MDIMFSAILTRSGLKFTAILLVTMSVVTRP